MTPGRGSWWGKRTTHRAQTNRLPPVGPPREDRKGVRNRNHETVPDLLPGTVEQALVADSISWLAAAKMAVFMAVLGAFGGGVHAHCHD